MANRNAKPPKVRGPGRLPGQQNRLTLVVKECLIEALSQVGGAAWFVKLANGSAEDRRTFAQVVARLVPHEINAKLDHRVVVHVQQASSRVEPALSRPAHHIPEVEVVDVESPS